MDSYISDITGSQIKLELPKFGLFKKIHILCSGILRTIWLLGPSSPAEHAVVCYNVGVTRWWILCLPGTLTD